MIATERKTETLTTAHVEAMVKALNEAKIPIKTREDGSIHSTFKRRDNGEKVTIWEAVPDAPIATRNGIEIALDFWTVTYDPNLFL